MHHAKSILGGSKDPKPEKDDENPGPGAYGPFPEGAPPGFRIELPVSKSRKEVDNTKNPLGPQRYEPVNPNHTQGFYQKPFEFANIPDQTFGKAERQDLVQTNKDMPGPGKYDIEGDFDKA